MKTALDVLATRGNKMEFLLQNWEVISLIITNIAALFVDSPKQRKRK